jgi:hypothetical protein
MSLSFCVAAQPVKLEGSKFTVESAAGGRLTPFSLSIVPGTAESPSLIAEEQGTGVEVPLQMTRWRLDGILPATIPAGTHTFTVKPGKQGEGAGVEVVKREKEPAIDVRIGGELLTTYHFDEKDRKPYLWPLKGEGGASLTRDFPFVPEGKTKDHPHHVSFWSAHGDVNGGDFWQYSEQAGWQSVGSVQSRSGDVVGSITSQDIWKDKDHKPVINEERTYRFYNTPAKARLMDVEVKFTAAYGEVKFGDTKEGGIVAFRMNDDLRETGGTGKITTSEGAVGEKAAWGKPAAWCDYSGTLEGLGARGIAVMDSPQSFRYPVHWHVRGYGLMGANPFGYHDFYNGAKNGDHTLPEGESITFSYRVYLHSGDATASDVAGHYKDFANPPKAEWMK